MVAPPNFCQTKEDSEDGEIRRIAWGDCQSQVGSAEPAAGGGDQAGFRLELEGFHWEES